MAFGSDHQQRPQAVLVRQLDLKLADRWIGQNHVGVSRVLSWQSDQIHALLNLPTSPLQPAQRRRFQGIFELK